MSEQHRTNLILIVAAILAMILVLGLQSIGKAKPCGKMHRPDSDAAHKDHFHIEVPR